MSPVTWLERGLECSALALIEGLKENSDVIERIVSRFVDLLKPLKNFTAAVFRAIVDENDFLGDGKSAHPPHDLFQRALFVVDRDEDGELHCSNSRFFNSRT